MSDYISLRRLFRLSLAVTLTLCLPSPTTAQSVTLASMETTIQKFA